MKKIRLILGISLIVQSVTFFVLCLVNLEKKKNLAKTFGAFSAAGGIAGVALLVSEYKNRKKINAAEDELFEDFEDFEDFDIDENDLVCSFEGSENEADA